MRAWVRPRIRLRRRLLGFLVVCGLGIAFAAPSARADETVYSCGPSFPNGVFSEADAFGFEETESCAAPGTNGTMEIYTSSHQAQGADAYWLAAPPSGLLIDEVQSVQGMIVASVNTNNGWGGGFFWGVNATSGVPISGGTISAGPYGVNQGTGGFPSPEFGFQLICELSAGCSSTPGASFQIGQVQFSVEETQAPTISGGGLWGRSGWVRGTWPISVSGGSPSGVCSFSASISGDPATLASSNPVNQTAWQQCSSAGLSGSFNTTLAANGVDTLNIADSDAAGLSASARYAVAVDNQAPTVALSGPATALSTAGTQYVSVNVNAGPSGAYGADCSVDGGPQTFYAGATSQVPVSGLGAHTVTCVGLNNAMSASGERASSAPGSFTVDIQQPTAEAITFSKIADSLRCRTVVKRTRVLGKPRTIRLHGHKVQVRRYHTVERHVRRCKARTARRRVLVVLKRHGKVVRRHGRVVHVKRTRRVVLLPRRVHKTVRHIKHGHRTTVSGILLTSGGTPLAGQSVAVMAAPNDADPQFAPMSSAVTDANGYWIAKIPRGPSRLIEAVYGGTATTAATISTSVKLVVPARVRILSHTPAVAWGQTVTFRGRVYGGFVPRAGINLKLRYGYGKSWVTYGVKTHVGKRGRFTTRFTFGPGDPGRHFRFHFQFSTLPGGDYPWSHANSNTVVVRVGGHPRVHHRRRDHRRGHRKHRRRP